MKKRYTIGVMIGNANSPHTMDLMQGIFHAADLWTSMFCFFLEFTAAIIINHTLEKIQKMIMITSLMQHMIIQAFADVDALSSIWFSVYFPG